MSIHKIPAERKIAITVAVKPSVVDVLDEQAQNTGFTRSALVAEILERFVNGEIVERDGLD